nr:hypothetical protein [Lachnospiraceae bacterium]
MRNTTRDSISVIKKKLCALALVFAVICTAIPAEYIFAEGTESTTNNAGDPAGDPASDPASTTETDISNSGEVQVDYQHMVLKITAKGQEYTLGYDEGTKTYTWPDGVSPVSVDHIDGDIKFNFANPRSAVQPGTYFRIPLPNVFAVDTTNNGSKDILATMEGSQDTYTLGNYTLENDGIVIHLTWEDLANPNVLINDAQVSFSAQLDKTKLSDPNKTQYEMFTSGGDVAGYIKIPSIPTEIGTFTKTGVVNDDNSITWTINIGDSMDEGVSLIGGTVVEELGANQTWEKAYWGTDETNTVAFVQDANNASRYTYQIAEGANVPTTAPAVLTVVTNPTKEIMEPDPNDLGNIKLTNNAKYFAAGKTEDSAKTAHDEVVIKKATLEKEGTPIDGNTIEWNLTFNTNEANVYRATLWDKLSEGLTVDDEFGIQVKEITDENETIATLKTGEEKTLNGVKLKYTLPLSEDGKQQIPTLRFDSTFSHKYLVTFRTKVSDTAFSGDTTIDNKAYVDVEYPAGGNGPGDSVQYGKPSVGVLFKNGFIQVKGVPVTDETKKTGILEWNAFPSTKANDYDGSTMTLTLENATGYGTHGFVAGSIKVRKKTDDSVVTMSKAPEITGDTATVTLDASTKLSDIYVYFQTKAETYFADDAKHTYMVKGDLEVRGKNLTNPYYAKQDSATLDLTNQMVKKSVSSAYVSSAYGDTTTQETLFTFVIDVNKNEIDLTHATVVDDLSECLYV